jgi:hypothetical protein
MIQILLVAVAFAVVIILIVVVHSSRESARERAILEQIRRSGDDSIAAGAGMNQAIAEDKHYVRSSRMRGPRI